MNDGRLEKMSWCLMGVAAAVQAAHYYAFDLASPILSFLSLISLLPLCGGIYAHLRSKQYQPFKQWQLYVYPAAAALVPSMAIVITLAVMWRLSWLGKKGEPAPVRDIEKGHTDWQVIAGGAAGLVFGVITAGKALEGTGDSPSGGGPFPLHCTCGVHGRRCFRKGRKGSMGIQDGRRIEKDAGPDLRRARAARRILVFALVRYR